MRREREAPPTQVPLRERVLVFLRARHTATVATIGPPHMTDAGLPHAASVFYAVDDRLRLVFLSKGSSRHGLHIVAAGVAGAPVAVTVAGEDDDWREIQGVQLWGTASVLRGAARAGAFATYVGRFVTQLREIDVFRVVPERAALTDNRHGLFGRELLEDLGKEA